MPVTQAPDFNRLKNKPTTLAGYGITDASKFGLGFNMTSQIGIKGANVNYTNATTQPRFVFIVVPLMGTTATLTVDGNQFSSHGNTAGGNGFIFAVVLPGQTYRLIATSGPTSWWEWGL